MFRIVVKRVKIALSVIQSLHNTGCILMIERNLVSLHSGIIGPASNLSKSLLICLQTEQK
jgi:hypothetical protein